MKIKFSKMFDKKIKQIKKNNIRLFQKVRKQLGLLQKNEKHPSLRLHKLSGIIGDNWSISVDMSTRILLYFSSDKKEVILVDIGTHDQVYKVH